MNERETSGVLPFPRQWEEAPTPAPASWQEERAQLVASIRARDEFIKSVSHELRNPMAAVLLLVQSLAKASQRGDTIADLPARLTTLELRVRSFINRATTFLDITRFNEGAYRLDSEPVLLEEVVSSVIDELRPYAEQAGCTVVTKLEAGIVGEWDRLAIAQVTSNLLSNAVKYGNGKPVVVSSWTREGHAFLQVADRGLGMSHDDQKRVFARFERAVKRRPQGGFGLGLWIVSQLVAHMDGRIDFITEPDAGSTFTVRLPLVPPHHREQRDV